jgi:hypothetical protein
MDKSIANWAPTMVKAKIRELTNLREILKKDFLETDKLIAERIAELNKKLEEEEK